MQQENTVVEGQTESVKFLGKITGYDKDGEHGKIMFKLGNGQTVTLELDKVSPVNKERALVHGLVQKIGDSVSGLSKEKKYGEAFEMLNKQCELMYSENWNFPREGFERGVSEETKQDLAVTIAKLKKVTFEQARAAVDKADTAKLKEWLKVPAIDKEIAKLVSIRKAELAKNSEVKVEDMDFGLEV